MFLNYSIQSKKCCSWIPPFLHPSFPASLLSWIPPFLKHSFPPFLNPFIYESVLTWISHFLSLSFLECLPSCIPPSSSLFSASLLSWIPLYWISHFLHPYFSAFLRHPASTSNLSCILPLPCLTPFLHPSATASLLSCITPVLRPSYPASLQSYSHLSCLPTVLHPTCTAFACPASHHHPYWLHPSCMASLYSMFLMSYIHPFPHFSCEQKQNAEAKKVWNFRSKHVR